MSLLLKLDTASLAVEFVAKMAMERWQSGIVFNPMRKDLRSNPHPFYRQLRERDPVHRSPVADGLVLSRYADVFTLLADREMSSDERNQRRHPRISRRRRLAGLPDPYDPDRATMLRMDPPDHTRLRGLVSKAFTPRAIDALRPRIEETVERIVQGLPRHGSLDLVEAIAGPLPVVVIAEVLGIPAEDHERFRHWSDEVVHSLGDSSLEESRRADRAMVELGDYLDVIAEERRASPREDLISGLVAAEEDGDRLTRDELLSTCVLLLVAGNETTTKLIGNGILALLDHPEQLQLLRDEPKRIDAAVEEILRYDGPVQFTSRMVLRDQVAFGRPVQRGQQVIAVLAAANRDPERFEDPDRLDITREDNRHLAFSYGTHFCLGARLARLETAIGLQAILTHMPGLARADEPVVWSTNTILRGPTRLPLRF